MTDRLPLFPLSHVLMPGTALPLRVFEPRYRALLADITAEGRARRFGVVALTAGFEVDAGVDDRGPRFESLGTVAELLEVEPQEDGTFGLLAVGSRRFRIESLADTSAPYLEAEVEYLAEPVGPLPAGLPGAARALSEEYARLLGQLTGSEPDSTDDPTDYPTDPVTLSYRLAAQAPLSQEDRQALLADEAATERLQRVQRVLRREVALLRRTRTIAVPPAAVQVLPRLN